MQNQSLEAIYHGHNQKVSDKWSLYLREYDNLFQAYRGMPVSILEVGIQNGGSLEIYDRYFEEATAIVGCDINPACEYLRYNSRKISVVIGDANLEETKRNILSYSKDFDIIIDDASHTSRDTIKLFCNYFESLKIGGTYIVEDLHCSYWQEYDGGLFHPYSAQSFFIALVNILNYRNWGLDLSKLDFLRDFVNIYDLNICEEVLDGIHSIKFVDSTCFVYKDEPCNNHVGTQVISGYLENIVPGRKVLHGSKLPVPSQVFNPWSEISPYPFDRYKIISRFRSELETCKSELETCKSELETCKSELETCKSELEHKVTSLNSLKLRLDLIENSRSWKLLQTLKRAKLRLWDK